MYRGFYRLNYSDNTPETIWGINGVAFLFGVSRATVYRWRNTWLAPAIWKEGRYVVADTEKAIKLFEINMLRGRKVVRRSFDSFRFRNYLTEIER